MRMSKSSIYVLLIAAGTMLFSCKAKDEYQGTEYAPNMYHSVPYEPLTQITNEEEGNIISNREDGKGEYYNSNPNNPHKMNMREPVANTVKRSGTGFLPYKLPKDSLDLAASILENPYEASEAIIGEGKTLYTTYCSACHGDTGQGDGEVGKVLKGVPSYSVGRVSEVSQGHVFHVITHGKGRMGAHGSQVDISDRWKIARYVQTLQNQN